MPADLTLIPDLPKRLGRSVTIGSNTFWTQLVLLLDDINFLKTTDWQDANGNPERIGMAALSRWIQQGTQGLTRLACAFDVCGFIDHWALLNTDPLVEARGVDMSRPHAVFCLSSTQIGIFHLEGKVSRIEAAVPALGQTVLREIEFAGWKAIPVFTPWRMLDVVSHLYWYGEPDEGTVLEELRTQSMSEEEVAAEDVLTRAKLQHTIPAYALEPQSDLPTAKLSRLRGQHDHFTSQVIDALLAVRKLRKAAAGFFPADGIEEEIIDVGCFLRWNASDRAVQVYDDLHNYWYQGDGYTDVLGVELVELSAAGLRRFFKQVDKGFALVRALDHLIALVSDPEKDSKDTEHDHDRST